MDEQDYYNNCEKCGRPFPKAKPSCGHFDGCLCEYGPETPACIKNKQPDCMAKAVIPAITAETTANITSLANCFVHVTNNNTTYYIDDKHRPMIVWAGTVEADDYDIEANPLNLRSQSLYSTIDGAFKHIYFDKQGVGHMMSVEEA